MGSKLSITSERIWRSLAVEASARLTPMPVARSDVAMNHLDRRRLDRLRPGDTAAFQVALEGLHDRRRRRQAHERLGDFLQYPKGFRGFQRRFFRHRSTSGASTRARLLSRAGGRR